MSMYDVAERSGALLRYLFVSLLNKASSLAEKINERLFRRLLRGVRSGALRVTCSWSRCSLVFLPLFLIAYFVDRYDSAFRLHKFIVVYWLASFRAKSSYSFWSTRPAIDFDRIAKKRPLVWIGAYLNSEGVVRTTRIGQGKHPHRSDMPFQRSSSPTWTTIRQAITLSLLGAPINSI
jgi:hypothetical protein